MSMTWRTTNSHTATPLIRWKAHATIPSRPRYRTRSGRLLICRSDLAGGEAGTRTRGGPRRRGGTYRHSSDLVRYPVGRAQVRSCPSEPMRCEVRKDTCMPRNAVLIVDDNELNLRLAETVLSHAGFEVGLARTAA